METPKTAPKTDKPREDNPPEAPENAYSHLLTLQDGRSVRYDVGHDAHQALPTVWNNIPVVRVSHATYAGQENTNE